MSAASDDSVEVRNAAVMPQSGEGRRPSLLNDTDQPLDRPASLDELIQRPTPICHEKDTRRLPPLKVIEKTGDLFDNAESTILVHACNCKGSWGAGIAAAFKKNFPEAFEAYAQHCKKSKPESLLGTALLIAPDEDCVYKNKDGKLISPPWIGCLFTSAAYGKRKDDAASILKATRSAMKDLLSLVLSKSYYREPDTRKSNEPYVGSAKNHHPNLRAVEILAIRMCQINSGLFGVPWTETKAVLQDVEVKTGQFLEVEVVSPQEKIGGKSPVKKKAPKSADTGQADGHPTGKKNVQTTQAKAGGTAGNVPREPAKRKKKAEAAEPNDDNVNGLTSKGATKRQKRIKAAGANADE